MKFIGLCLLIGVCIAFPPLFFVLLFFVALAMLNN